MTQSKLLVKPVPVVAGMTPYTGAPVDPLVELKLDSNESLSPVPPLDAVAPEDGSWRPNRYQRTSGLEARLAVIFGIDSDQVTVTAGADDALERAVRAVCEPGRQAILTTPTFEPLERYVRHAGATTLQVPWWAGDFPIDEVCALATPETALVAVVSPNNPTGAVASRHALRELSLRLPGTLILVDHAYVEYGSPEHDLTQAALELPTAVVFLTFSKAWSAAGLRVGYALGDSRVIRWLRILGQPYPVAAPSLAMVLQMLDASETPPADRVERVRCQRRQLSELLAELGIEQLPSAGNFILARFNDAARTRRELACLGVGVRPFPDRGELERWLRFTVPGEDGSYARLEAALRTVLAPEALLFDLDGVIADVSRSYREAMRLTAEAFGVQITTAEIASAKAAGSANNDWELTSRLLARHGVEPPPDEVKDRFEEIYQGGEDNPGLHRNESLLIALETLERLAAERPLAVVTGRPRRDADRFLQQNGIAEFFAAVVTMEDAPLKPDPRPIRLALERLGVRHAWMVGDTPDDMRAARSAGVLPIGCRAPGDAAVADTALREAGAAHILTTVDHLEGVLP